MNNINSTIKVNDEVDDCVALMIFDAENDVRWSLSTISETGSLYESFDPPIDYGLPKAKINNATSVHNNARSKLRTSSSSTSSSCTAISASENGSPEITNWILGVRQRSLSSDRLNSRMAARGMQHFDGANNSGVVDNFASQVWSSPAKESCRVLQAMQSAEGAANKSNRREKRLVNHVTLTVKQELQRYRKQRVCEAASLITVIIALIFITITPFLLIPIWVTPNQYSPLIKNLLWCSLACSIFFLTLGALTGNVYWYYDEKKQKWKWFYHCGSGPTDHYWGATLFHYIRPRESNVTNNCVERVNV